MEWTSTKAVRWRLSLVGLIAGPVLLVVSSVFIVPGGSGGMRADFDAMAARPWLLVVQSALEAAGFAVSLAAFAAVARVADRRGGALATTGTVLCVLGALGFMWSAAGGMFLSVLVRMDDREAGFAAAVAVNGDAVTGALISVLMLAGEAGILLVLLGMLRAGRIRIWPVVLVVAGVVADLVLPGVLSGLTADVLLLAAAVWTVLSLRRSGAPQGAPA
ncbi:MAG: hypothetical protein WA971_12450 [Microbacterium sp.]